MYYIMWVVRQIGTYLWFVFVLWQSETTSFFFVHIYQARQRRPPRRLMRILDKNPDERCIFISDPIFVRWTIYNIHIIYTYNIIYVLVNNIIMRVYVSERRQSAHTRLYQRKKNTAGVFYDSQNNILYYICIYRVHGVECVLMYVYIYLTGCLSENDFRNVFHQSTVW